jgi:hypothetical protein
VELHSSISLQKSEEFTSNGDALKGLKVSNVGGGKEVLHEVFRYAMNEARIVNQMLILTRNVS